MVDSELEVRKGPGFFVVVVFPACFSSFLRFFLPKIRGRGRVPQPFP